MDNGVLRNPVNLGIFAIVSRLAAVVLADTELLH